MSPDEWLLMGDIEKLIGQTFPREVVPGFEPAVAPITPLSRAQPVVNRGPSLRARRGLVRRR
jgi:hypothetical protein